jgi:hypothetical protein
MPGATSELGVDRELRERSGVGSQPRIGSPEVWIRATARIRNAANVKAAGLRPEAPRVLDESVVLSTEEDFGQSEMLRACDA